MEENLIEFYSEEIDFPAIDVERVSRWIAEVVKQHDLELGEITYNFTNDDRILEYNKQYLQHDFYTDIITFDYDHDGVVSGDIVISLDTVASNAEQYGTDPDEELLRVIIHGVLHLCGIDDKGPGEREIMEAEENKALALYATVEWFLL